MAEERKKFLKPVKRNVSVWTVEELPSPEQETTATSSTAQAAGLSETSRDYDAVPGPSNYKLTKAGVAGGLETISDDSDEDEETETSCYDDMEPEYEEEDAASEEMDEEEALAMMKYLHAKDYEGPSSDSDSDRLPPVPISCLFQQDCGMDSSSESDEDSDEGDEENLEEGDEDLEEGDEDFEEDDEDINDEQQEPSNLHHPFILPLSFNEAHFMNNDRSTLYHTGSPDMISVCALIDQVYPSKLRQNLPEEKLTLKEQFIMVLIRFRKGDTLEDLGYLFEVSKEKVAEIFLRHLEALAATPQMSVTWPETERFTKNIPRPLISIFGSKPIVLLSIVEVELLDVPINYRLRLELYAPKKRWHSFKFVIATTVEGEIVFASKAWGGRVSNSHVIENSGIADKLAENQSLVPIAARNLLAEKIKFEDFVVTPFTFRQQDGKTFLKAWSLESCKKINALQSLVVEAVNRCHSKMKLFRSALFGEDLMKKCRHDDLTIFDKLIKVWAVLCNMCHDELE